MARSMSRQAAFVGSAYRMFPVISGEVSVCSAQLRSLHTVVFRASTSPVACRYCWAPTAPSAFLCATSFFYRESESLSYRLKGRGNGLFPRPLLVEMRGVEPLSEKKSTRVSPGAVCLQHSRRARPVMSSWPPAKLRAAHVQCLNDALAPRNTNVGRTAAYN